MEDRDYFFNLLDEEIEKRVERLSPVLKKIFEEEVEKGKTRRHSLFIALSFCSVFGRERS